MDSVEIFISYAHEDEKLREKLETHLALLKKQGLVRVWHSHKIGAGLVQQAEVDKHLHTAQIILLLISADFLNSDYHYDIEMQQAIQRHEQKQTCVIPIILRPVYLENSPFEHLLALPPNATPVTRYPNQDEAMLEIVVGIAKIAREQFIQDIDTSQAARNSPTTPIPIASMYLPILLGNRGIASFMLNMKEHIIHYKRQDNLRKQTFTLRYNNQELVRDTISDFPSLKTLEKRHHFQIDGVDCVFIFKMLPAIAMGMMSVRIEVGGVTVFSY